MGKQNDLLQYASVSFHHHKNEKIENSLINDQYIFGIR